MSLRIARLVIYIPIGSMYAIYGNIYSPPSALLWRRPEDPRGQTGPDAARLWRHESNSEDREHPNRPWAGAGKRWKTLEVEGFFDCDCLEIQKLYGMISEMS